MNSDIVSYYKERVKEYEKVYRKPERQSDLLTTAEILQATFTNKKLFEIACRSGYWTEIISKVATSIVATDINETVIDVARSKKYSPGIVQFEVAGIFNAAIKYESVLGGFYMESHKIAGLKSFYFRQSVTEVLTNTKAMERVIDRTTKTSRREVFL